MRRFIVIAVAALGFAGPASAIDLTGSWHPFKHSTCTGLDANGQKIALKNRDILFGDLPLTQVGSELRSAFDAYFWVFGGRVYEDPGGTKGQGILQKCDGPPAAPAFVAYRITKAETFPANSKGVSGKMTTLYVFGTSFETYSCNIFWERTSTVDPEIGACP